MPHLQLIDYQLIIKITLHKPVTKANNRCSLLIRAMLSIVN
ncbi:MAG: hypothetical protein JWR38_937 [Mucilaginibacter sp.]|nr:hypothetical protein [Mucilaginibacter sp.]